MERIHKNARVWVFAFFFSQMEYLRVKHNLALSECGDTELHSLSIYNKVLISRGSSPSG